jgi:hypothetical protein
MMKKTSLALATGCAVIGAAVASVVVPAGADQIGSPAGTVTIQSPSVRLGLKAGTRNIFPRFKSSGNIETSASYLTVKQGSKTIVSNKTGIVEGLKRGTYTITTKVNYHYVTFRQQKVQVVTKGVRIEDVVGYYGYTGEGITSPAILQDCKVTSLDAGAKTFAASCALQYKRAASIPESDQFDITVEKLGSMTFTGTYEGTTAKQDGYPDSEFTIVPQVGGSVSGPDLRATKDVYLTFFNRKAGPWHSKSKTMTVLIDKNVA